MESNENQDHMDFKESNENKDHMGSKESNLDLLIKMIGDKCKRKREDSKFEESISTDFMIESDEESEIELETKGSLLDKDIFNTFNEDYETYLSSNSDLEPEMTFEHPLFSSYKLKNVTPLVKYLLSLREVPNPLINHSEYHINSLISKRINTLLKSKKTGLPQLSSRVKYLFTCLNTYVDVFYLNSRIRSLDSVRFTYALHIANHITKCSTTKSSRKKESHPNERTEGFTRPKVLVICGLRCIAKDIITNLLQIIPTSKSNKNLERFEMDFSLSDEDLKEQSESYLKTKKAEDFVMTFSGNQDDAFKIGIRYESGLLHLYSPFYSSDIIIASPLGLRPLISNEPDYDFLSSIEILIIDRLDIIKFQNWKLFIDLFNVINKPLLKWRDGDINRIRMSIIDGQIQEYRQNIIISSSRSVIFNSFFKNLKNKRGSVRLSTPNKSDYIQLASKFNIQQLFIKVPSINIKNSYTDTIKYFIENMLPNLEDINGILLILSDYTQYFSISKKLKGTNVQYLTCLESNTPKQMKFARQQFQSRNIPILITTIRLLFFKRYLFKGSSKIFLLEPPEYVQIYKDLIRMIDENRNNTIICYYTNYHAIVLEPIVGSNRISKLINAPDTKITQFN